MYWLCTLAKKNNLRCQINCQEIGKQELYLEIYSQYYLHIYCKYYAV